MAVSQEYKNAYEQLHKAPNMFPGRQTAIAFKYISPILSKYDCKTVIDYGCGKAEQYFKMALHKKWGVRLALYDIGVPEYAIKPTGTYDATLCIDVLEHLEEEAVLETLTELDQYAKKVVIASIATRPAKKTLPDGRNAHLTIKPEDWWVEQITKVAKNPWYVMFENEANGINRIFSFAYINVSDSDRAEYQEFLSSI